MAMKRLEHVDWAVLSRQECIGEVPPPMEGHSLAVMEDHLFCLGGWSMRYARVHLP